MKSLVSVIMPVYNAGPYVAQAIKSILNQSWSSIELLILDDGSNDNSRDEIAAIKDTRIKFIEQKENIGYLKAANKLFSLCKGNYVTFQDADDSSANQRIEKQVNALINDPNAIASACNYNIITNNESRPGEKIKNFMPRNTSAEELFKLLGSSILIKKDRLKAVGYFNSYFDRLGGEDMEWLMRVNRVGNISVVNEPLYSYRLHVDSVSNNIDNERKLFINDLLFLVDQKYMETGNDILTAPDINKDKFLCLLDSFVTKKSLSIKYQQLGTRYVDREFKKEAFTFILKAITLDPFRKENLRAFLYFIRNLPK